MEETQIEKKTKQKKVPPPIEVQETKIALPQNPIVGLIESGIPLKKVIFQTTVNAASGEPEYIYYNGGTHRASRNALLYWTPTGVIKIQNDIPELIPLANVKQATVLI